MDTDPSLHHHLASTYRSLQPNLQSHQPQHPQHVQNHQHHQHVQHHQQHSPIHQTYAQDLSSLVNDDYHHDLHRLQAVNHSTVYHHQAQSPFDPNHGQQQHRHMQHDSPHTPEQDHHQQTHPGLRPYPLMHQHQTPAQHNSIQQLQQDDVFGTQSEGIGAVHEPGDSHIAQGSHPTAEAEKREEDGETKFKLVPSPPDLEAWRQKLFDVNEMITLSEDDYYTYFPHVDNVYSHRSTQKYKRKPFISHYWDCRLKGRPPGTPKSEDPTKKKRKRTARERDLCDVKIKITEYFEGAMLRPGFVADDGNDGDNNGQGGENVQQHQGTPMHDGQHGQHQDNVDPNDANNYYATHSHSTPQQPSHPNLHPQFQTPSHPPSQPLRSFSNPPHPGATGARYFTIQRVNGNGGNGKGDGVAGPHKHTLADSDKVKKNSVVRHMLKEAKEMKRATGVTLRGGSIAAQRAGHVRKAIGEAANTIRKHAKAVPKDGASVILYGSCTDVFTQRVWIALEVLKIPYQYIEADHTSLPDKLLEVCPRPELPAIRKGNWGVGGANVVLEYLNEVAQRHMESTAANGAAAAKGSGTPSRRASSRTTSMPADASSTANSAPPVGVGEDAVSWAGAVGRVVDPSSSPSPSTISLLPSDPQDRAYARQWAQFVDSHVVPAYNNYLRHGTPSHSQSAEHPATVPPHIFGALQDAIIQLVAAAHPVGPFFSGTYLSYVDVAFAPTVLRIGMLLVGGNGRPGRGWLEPQRDTRWDSWVKALESDPRIKATCSDANTYEEEWARERQAAEALMEDEVGRRRSDEGI